MSSSRWYKNEETDKIWWKETDSVGEWVFSFQQKKRKSLIRRTHTGKNFLEIGKSRLVIMGGCYVFRLV